MLDQNTDRMWFVIGAVIVGAAIIFIANGTLPDVFASVTETFSTAANEGLTVVDQIGQDVPYYGNMIDFNKHTLHPNRKIDGISGKFVPNIGTEWYSSIGDIDVIEGITYQLYGGDIDIVSATVIFLNSELKPISRRHATGRSKDGVIIEAPVGARYVRVQAGDESIRSNEQYGFANPDKWIFRRYPDEKE